MAALKERDISLIKDEDLLKKLWQDTEDFGKKKEIRAHMYKLREEKLKDLYCNTDMRDIQISKNAKTSFAQSTHADSLVDHSFASLKSKEIRDSESPSREMSYRLSSGTNNQGWNVSKTDEYSQDGKTHRIAHSAHTSGTEIIPKGGKLDYEASNKQEVVSFQDGDDKNFVKSQQTSSNTHVKQEAHGGDEHGSFQTSSSKTSSSSSSRKVIEQKSSYNDNNDIYVQNTIKTPQIASSNNEQVIDKTVKVYTTDAPIELKTHPGYMDGRTKVTRESKTLADGTVVTTTKYETSGANEVKTASSNQYVSSCSSSVRENRANITSFNSQDEQTTTQRYIDDTRDKQQAPKSSRYYVEKTHNIPNNRSENFYENVDSTAETDVNYKTTKTRQSQQQTRRNSDQKTTTDHKVTVDKVDYKSTIDDRVNRKEYSSKDTIKTAENTSSNKLDSVPVGTPIEIEINIGRTLNDIKTNNERTTTRKSIAEDRKTDNEHIVYDVPQKREPIKPVETDFKRKPTEGQYDTTYRTDFTNKKISVEVSPTHDAFARSLRAVSPDRLSSRTSSRNLKNSTSSLRSSSSPEKTFMDRRQPSRMSPDRHHASPSKKTPDRFSSSETITYKSTPNSQRNSPVKSTDTSKNYNTTNTTESIRTSKRITPDKSLRNHNRDMTTDLDDVVSVTSHTTVTKFRPSTLEYSTKKTRKVTERSPTSPLRIEKEPIVSTKSNTYEERSSKVENKEVITKKERPQDRPLKRSDTYEERCRQILGITSEPNERRRGSLDRLKRRGSSTSTHTEIITHKITNKKSSPSPTKEFPHGPTKSSRKQSSPSQELPYQNRKSPEKSDKNVTLTKRISTDKNVVQEFPAQIRRSPDKKTSANKDIVKQQETIITEKKHFVGQKDIQEFPSQVRKSPERRPMQHSTCDVNINEESISSTDTNVIQEFPAQIRKTPENIVSKSNIEINETLITSEKHTSERERIQEFPAQIRRSPDKKNESPIPEPKKQLKEPSEKESIQEFPAQIRRSPDKKTESPIPEPKKQLKEQYDTNKTNIKEFPSQIRKQIPNDDIKKVSDNLRQNVELEITVSSKNTENISKRTTKKKIPSKDDSSSSSSDSENETTENNYRKLSREVESNFSDHKNTDFKEQIDKETYLVTKTNKVKKDNDNLSFNTQQKSEDINNELDDEVTTHEEYVIKENIHDTIIPKSTDKISEISRETGENTTSKKTETDSRNVTCKTSKTSEKVTHVFSPKNDETPKRKPQVVSHDIGHKNSTIETKKTVQQSTITTDHKCHCQHDDDEDEEDHIIKRIPTIKNSERRSVQKNISTETFNNKTAKPSQPKPSIKQIVNSSKSDKEHQSKRNDREEIKTVQDSIRINGHKPSSFDDTKLYEEVDIRQYIEEIEEEPFIKNKPNTFGDTSKINHRTPSAPKLTPASTKTIVKPTGGRKPSKTNLTDSTESNDDHIEDKQEKKYIMETYEGRTPVEEVLIPRKSMSLLYSDDEDEKKTTQLLIESEITDHQTITDVEEPKERKTPKTTSSRLITNEKTSSKVKNISKNVQIDQEQPIKKPLLENNQNKAKFNGKNINRVKQHNKIQNTLSDIENFDEIKKDETTTHIRTHRIDDNINNKKKTVTTKLEISPKTQIRKPNVTETTKTKPNSRNVSEKTSNNKQYEPLSSPSKINKISTSQIKTTITSKSSKDDRKVITKNVDQSKIKETRYVPKKKKVDSSDSEDESIPDSLNEETISKTVSKTTTSIEKRIPSRTLSKPDIIDKSKTPKPKLEKRCLSTKSIIMNHDTTRGITIDLQRSISSREATPDKVCPLPVVSSDDDTTSSPRYPDKVVEPEEPTNKKNQRNLFEITIRENEDGYEARRRVDITEESNRKVTDVDRVDVNDESLLTVNKKINRFLNTVEKLTDKTVVDISQPAPKVQRPKFEVHDDLKEDDCLLSVSDKVSKFITEAEQLTSQKTNQNKTAIDIDIKSDVSKRVNQFTISAADNKPKEINRTTIVKNEPSKLAPKSSSPQQKRTDVTLQQDVFITTECEQIEKEEDIFRTPQRSSSPQKDSSPSRSPVREPKKHTESPISKSKITRSPERISPSRQTNTLETSSTDKKITETLSKTTKTPSRSDSFKEFTPKNNRRPSQEEKVILSSVGRIRSSESIKKARALFENEESIKREKKRQENILTRPSVFESRPKSIREVKKVVDRSKITPRKLDFPSDATTKTADKPPKPQNSITVTKYLPDGLEPTTYRTPSKTRLLSPEKEMPGYMKPLDRSLRGQSPQKEDILDRPESPSEMEESTTKNSSVHEEDLPGYMKPLDRSLRAQSPKKEFVTSREVVETPTKFGVTLKRTYSNKEMVGTSATNKKHPILLKKIVTEKDIEQIYQLEVLEELLLKLTGYEIRRTIRNQIRIVKQLISENKLEITIRNIHNKIDTDKSKKIHNTSEKTTRDFTRTSPSSKTSDKLESTDYSTTTKQHISEYSSSYSRKQSSSSITRMGSLSPERKSPTRITEDIVTNSYTATNTKHNRKSPERKSPERKREEKTTTSVTQQTTYRSTYDKSKPSSSNNTFSKSSKSPKSPSSTDQQPEWISNRNLKKVTPSPSNEVSKKSIVSSSKSTSIVKKQNRTSSPPKEIKPTDLITSSYGVGPTDENGAPLFGLRALRAQNKTGINDSSTKVQGTVITSQFYSETGKEPVGKISVTKYSTDPKDLGADEDLQQEGVLSVTTTQKFGYDDSPSLQQLTNIENDICDIETEKSTLKSSKLTRKNSVKALTQKFVEAETSKSERQSSYPKAGLILRSSSFKKSNDSDNEKYSGEENIEETISTSSTTSTRVVSGGTFLRNKSKVTGVQDAITRMKAKDIEDGDTEEDIEAKGLLNKYLGAQVILSEMEGHVSKTATARAISSATATKSTTKVTTVTIENGKEVKKVTVFEHPISEDVLENVWDEQTLRYLLEESTDYEERRRIRARLRVVMAEQEACTELVKQASQEQSGRTIDGTVEESEEISSEGSVTTKVSTRVVTQQQQISKKPLSPFAKFRQLDKQNSLNTPPSTPRTPGGSPLFKFTDAALSQSASTIKDRLLHWCRMKTKEYENIQLDNFSTSWADGLAFCALIHHFLPESFDYHSLNPKERRHNFELAFKVADEKADIAPLLDVDDMVETRRPDWKCVFTYVQSIYRRFKDED